MIYTPQQWKVWGWEGGKVQVNFRSKAEGQLIPKIAFFNDILEFIKRDETITVLVGFYESLVHNLLKFWPGQTTQPHQTTHSDLNQGYMPNSEPGVPQNLGSFWLLFGKKIAKYKQRHPIKNVSLPTQNTTSTWRPALVVCLWDWSQPWFGDIETSPCCWYNHLRRYRTL